MTDFRALCGEILQLLDYYIPEDGRPTCWDTWRQRARAALADEPAVPEGREPASVTERPTVMQLIELSYEIEDAGLGQIDFARAVLARWGNSAPQPVPVSERLPRSEDCDAEGKCWWGWSESDGWSAY